MPALNKKPNLIRDAEYLMTDNDKTTTLADLVADFCTSLLDMRRFEDETEEENFFNY